LANGTSFFDELKRRNVYRVGIAYAIVSWLLLQVIDVVDPIIGIPEWVPKLILVLVAVGLPLALVFAWAYEMTPEGLKREKDVDRSASITHETGQRLNRTIIGVLVIAVGLLLADRSMFDRRNEPTAEPVAETSENTAPTDAVVAPVAPSIAVLPFANMSADESSTYFSDGLADTLLHMLAQIREIRVAARTSSFQFRDQNTDITKIAEALNVGTVLEGSVQRAGNKIRVTAQLIEADTGFHLWSGNFDRDLDDVFAIQDEIANEVVAALKVSLLGESAEVLTQHDTDNVEAYTEYLLGIDDLNRYTFESLPRAEQRFKNAIRLDPDYATAWAKLGYTYLYMLDTGIGTQAEMVQKAKDAASKALELDESSAMAIAVLGRAEEALGDDDSAEQLYRRAMEINQSETTAALFYAGLLEGTSRRSEVPAILRRVLTLDPLSTSVYNQLASHYRITRDFEAALAATNRLIEINPDSPVAYYRAAEIKFASGDWAQAIISTLKAFEYDPDDPELATMIGDYYLALELPADARKWYDRAVEIDAAHPVSIAAPLRLHMINGTAATEGLPIARKFLADELDDRQGARGVVLHTIWDDAVTNDSHEEALEYLRDFFPEYFEEDGDWSQWSFTTDWFMGAILIDVGREELGMRVLQPMLEDSREYSETYATSVLHTWNLAAAQDKEAVLDALRSLIEQERAPANWPTAIDRLRAFDFVRDEPEFVEYIAFLKSRAAEQREVLAELLGTDTKKRGPT
jgi:TolB-like protein/Tfp pilus assembly protein PilF